MPGGKLPEKFGTGEDDFPEDFLGQLLHPFVRQDGTKPATATGEENRGAA
jgi:hypothetical protein